jgi:hypothetical protein
MGKPENILAGEGKIIERGLSAPSLNSLPLSNRLKHRQHNSTCLRGGTKGRVS